MTNKIHTAKNLIDRLLTFDPNERITAEEALSHPWIAGSKEAGPRTSTNLAPTIRKAYSSRASFTAVAMLNKIKTTSSASEYESDEDHVKHLDIKNDDL